MATVHGTQGRVEIGTNLVARITGWTLNETMKPYDTTDVALDNPAPAETHIAGPTAWTATIECNWDKSDTTGQGALTIGASVVVHLEPEGNATGDTDITGTASVVGIRRQVSDGALVSATFDVQGNGVLTYGTHA